jgi:hypothetical protein
MICWWAHPDGKGWGARWSSCCRSWGESFNTLGSKSQDADVSALVIAAKAELEKIREQAQNIE